jgi:hypothetical protein
MIAYDGRCFARAAIWRAAAGERGHVSMAIISDLTPKMLIVKRRPKLTLNRRPILTPL